MKDTPFCILKEILGWNTWPDFASQWATLLVGCRFHCRPIDTRMTDPTLQEMLWPQMFPTIQPVLDALQWWADAGGRYIHRTDSYGSVRRFKVGHDSLSILHEWLCDFHRERELRPRIRRKFHRDDPQCATGLDLPGPPERGFCLFAGHRVAWASDGTKYLKHAAMASGGSVWYKFPGSSSFDPGDLRWNCRCGLYKPSRVHLVWSCPETAHLRPPHVPQHRVEERLFAKVVQERPGPGAVPHFDSYYDDITTAILRCLETSSEVIVATDGSADAQASVASWCVALPQIHRQFAGGLHSEDQSAYRGEIAALHVCLRVITTMIAQNFRLPSRVLIACDCLSAMSLVQTGQGKAALLAKELRSLTSMCASNGVILDWQWVPSHGRLVPTWRPHCRYGEAQLRAWNAVADRGAKAECQRLLLHSPRAPWIAACKAAAKWETDTLWSVSRIAEHYASWEVE